MYTPLPAIHEYRNRQTGTQSHHARTRNVSGLAGVRVGRPHSKIKASSHADAPQIRIRFQWSRCSNVRHPGGGLNAWEDASLAIAAALRATGISDTGSAIAATAI